MAGEKEKEGDMLRKRVQDRWRERKDSKKEMTEKKGIKSMF